MLTPKGVSAAHDSLYLTRVIAIPQTVYLFSQDRATDSVDATDLAGATSDDFNRQLAHCHTILRYRFNS